MLNEVKMVPSLEAGIIQPARVVGSIRSEERPRLFVRDLITAAAVRSNRVEYLKLTAPDGAAESVPEGEQKPEAAISFTMDETPIVTIATTIPVSQQMLDDAAEIVRVVDSELQFMVAAEMERQILYGEGSGDLLGLHAHDIPEIPAGDSLLDTILAMSMAVRTAGHNPTGVVLSPADAEAIFGLKADGSGNYLFSDVHKVLALGLFAIIAQSTDVFRVIGVGWIGAASARSFSFVRDNSRSGANLGAIVMEAAIGLSMLVPWDSFFGA
jgi:HK97 family phage major capsid protein